MKDKESLSVEEILREADEMLNQIIQKKKKLKHLHLNLLQIIAAVKRKL